MHIPSIAYQAQPSPKLCSAKAPTSRPLLLPRFGAEDKPKQAKQVDPKKRQEALIAHVKHYAMAPEGLALDAVRSVGFGALFAFGTPVFVVTYPLSLAFLTGVSLWGSMRKGLRGEKPEKVEKNLADYWKKANWSGVKENLKDYISTPKQWLWDLGVGGVLGAVMSIGTPIFILTVPVGLAWAVGDSMCQRVRDGLQQPMPEAIQTRRKLFGLF